MIPGVGGDAVPKKPKAEQEKIGTEVPPGAVIYGCATVEEVDGMRQVHIHGRGSRFTSLLAKKGAREVVLPGASIVAVSLDSKYVAWDGETYVLRPTLESIQETDHLTLVAKINDPQADSPPTGENGKEGKATRRTAEVLNILIASPSDVTEERDIVEKVLHAWNASHFERMGVMLRPVRWESHAYPASGNRPQAIINKQIVESGDILIGTFGYRLGTPTGDAQSGTIEEIEEFRKAGKYVALYFSTADVPRSADRAQLEALEAYKRERQKDTFYFEFEDAAALRDHLTRQLPKIVDDVRRRLSLASSSERRPAAGNQTKPSDSALASPLIFVGSRVLPVSDNGETWTGEMGRFERQWATEQGRVALVAKFTNEARPNAPNRGWLVKANLIFREQGKEVRRIVGSWLEEPTDFAEIRVDETRELLLIAVIDQRLHTIGKRRLRIDLNSEEVLTDVEPLPSPAIVSVTVRLTDADTGQFLMQREFKLQMEPLSLEEL